MEHLNGILARVGGNFRISQMPGGCPGGCHGMLKLRFDRYISSKFEFRCESFENSKFNLIHFVNKLIGCS